MEISLKRNILGAFILALALSLQCGGATSTAGKAEPASREAELSGDEAEWAKPLTKPGLPNLHEVAPGLYRGAQPEKEGFRSLEAMGVKTVVNLRRFHSDSDDLADVGLTGSFELIEIPMNAYSVREEDVIFFLKTVTDESKQPLFFHCQHGADRTGTMAAAYRIVVQGWRKEDAIQEMRDGGFGRHEIFANLVKLLQNLDVEKIERAL